MKRRNLLAFFALTVVVVWLSGCWSSGHQRMSSDMILQRQGGGVDSMTLSGAATYEPSCSSTGGSSTRTFTPSGGGERWVTTTAAGATRGIGVNANNMTTGNRYLSTKGNSIAGESRSAGASDAQITDINEFLDDLEEEMPYHPHEMKRYERVYGGKIFDQDENPYLDPRREPISTFGIDADKSSYAKMRRCIEREEELPPPESVRIEGYVNAFAYDYPKPKGRAPMSVVAEIGTCPWNRMHNLLRLGFRAKDLTDGAPRNLVFLVDVSGSMKGTNRIECVKAGLKTLARRLRPEDRLAIVVYASEAKVLLDLTSGVRQKALLEAIEKIAPVDTDGWLDPAAVRTCLRAAYYSVGGKSEKKTENRVVLISDGSFKIDADVEKTVTRWNENGFELSVLGIGLGRWRDDAMRRLAELGTGIYTYLRSPADARKAFSDLLTTKVARDAKMQVEFNPAQVGNYRLLGYERGVEMSEDDETEPLEGGDVCSGQMLTVLYEIAPVGDEEEDGDPLRYQKRRMLPEDCDFGDELGAVTIRWKSPTGEKEERAVFPFKALRRETNSESFRFASSVAEFALLLKDSRYRGSANFQKLIRRARDAKGGDDDGSRAEFIRLAERAEALAEDD